MEIEREAKVEINGMGTKTELNHDELITGTIDSLKEEKEYPHIIEKLKPKEEIETFIIRYPDNQELMDKINEIIEVVNIMNRGGRKWM